MVFGHKDMVPLQFALGISSLQCFRGFTPFLIIPLTLHQCTQADFQPCLSCPLQHFERPCCMSKCQSSPFGLPSHFHIAQSTFSSSSIAASATLAFRQLSCQKYQDHWVSLIGFAGLLKHRAAWRQEWPFLCNNTVVSLQQDVFSLWLTDTAQVNEASI